jgi:predicted DNA-binding ribbon-helix-helix protein
LVAAYTITMQTGLPRRLRRNHVTAPSSLVIHNVVVGSHRTSVRLEPVMWDALRDIAHRHRVTLHNLVTDIDRERTASSLTAAIRVYIVDFYRAAALPAAQVQLRAIGPPRLPTRPN